MKKFFKVLLIIVITIIVIALALAAYVLIKNPLGAGDILKASLFKTQPSVEEVNNATNKVYDHPLLNDDQEQKLINAGVDLEKLPAQITPEQKSCAIEKLGEARVQEIISGSQPSSLEIIKLMPCL